MKLNLGKFAPVLATVLLGATVALSQRATAEKSNLRRLTQIFKPR